ncbi:MAG: hypothetical protein ACYC6A_03550 [Armatimonadota bacterium]
MSNATDRRLRKKAGEAWRYAWQRLFHPRTQLFYDFVSSFDAEMRFDHLPTVEEITRQYPNTNGWATGMEDSSISAGVMISTICDRYAATGDAGLRAAAGKVFAGMVLCGTLSPAKGLVLRSVSPRDGKSYYIESSRDQYTHFAHGLWRFYHSPLADDAQRATMRQMMTDICTRLERHMTPEHGFAICMEDGRPGNVDGMWHVAPHEAARLPMIYLIGWDLTGDRHWRGQYRRYARRAAKASLQVPLEMRTPYAYLQEQVSLEALHALENEDEELKDLWRQGMEFVAGRIERFTWQWLDYAPVDITPLDLDWHHWPMHDQWGRLIGQWPQEIDREFRTIREPAEALLAQLMCPGRPLPTDQKALLERLIDQTDYRAVITYSSIYPLAAYWRAAASGELAVS